MADTNYEEIINRTYEEVLEEMLSRVPDTLDKREGSVMYTILAPAAYLLAQQNYMLSYMADLLFADTSAGEWLDRITGDFGIAREQATKALRQINTYDAAGTPMKIPVGIRFSVGEQTYCVKEEITAGQYKAECEQAGTVGNHFDGTALPIDYINGLGSAILVTQPLIPARDTETDDSLRERFYAAVQRAPFGGNIADYQQKTLEIEGVGAVHVFSSSKLNPPQAGHVGIIIGDEQGKTATAELISKVQAVMGTDGDGIAPVGHTVLVATSHDQAVNVTASVRVKSGSSFEIVKPVIEKTIQNYISGITFEDETVFLSKLTANILNCDPAIVDVGTVTLNGTAVNLTLEKSFENYQVPVPGTITITEAV